eukprot:14798461-Alexandrium_andersonii.AAC.1
MFGRLREGLRPPHPEMTEHAEAVVAQVLERCWRLLEASGNTWKKLSHSVVGPLSPPFCPSGHCLVRGAPMPSLPEIFSQ